MFEPHEQHGHRVPAIIDTSEGTMRTATLIDPRPTDPRPIDSGRFDSGRTRTAPRRTDVPRPVVDRPVDNRPGSASRPSTTRAAQTRCASPVGTRGRGPVPSDAAVFRRRRRAAVAILAGVGLALTVWVISVVGQNYAASVAPAAVSAEVVHVRSGDSLSTIASRVAPDMPREVVIDEIVAMNDLPSSALQVGQPLLTPRYR
ncbi:LysM peptidoglycan-binding domain-containing protein [Gordonia sp. 'Campus']|uniref:LysM peptidoglycan-binding domain-containing protein n=1 Tax=Gordonia sp. 'Campus' TaxID=2915824 RepID=UPI0035B3C2A6